MSSLRIGRETNAGLTYKLLAEAGAQRDIGVLYESGIQWKDWKSTGDVIAGVGINRQIKRAYGWLASRYKPGDRIILLGYSRGAYAVRSLAGVIDRIGLVRAEFATVRHIRQAYRHYEHAPESAVAQEFAEAHCVPGVDIEMVGVWDTVKALGWRAPVLWRFSQRKYEFHDHRLGRSIKTGYHALALDETRVAYSPVIWEWPANWPGHVEQVWFRGTHGDIGGQLNGYAPARPLANIPLVWMLGKLEAMDVTLPVGWRGRFPQDAAAPSAGNIRGWGKLFLSRRQREIGRDRSEQLHPSAAHHPIAKNIALEQSAEA